MNKIVLFLIFLLWNILHIYFLWFNEILKVADSFAYLQMAYLFNNFELWAFGTWWFGFLYSFLISIANIFIWNDIFRSFFINIILFNLLAISLYFFGKKYFYTKYLILFLILIFLSPILLNYNINILSENIYILLFLILFLLVLNLEIVFWYSLIVAISLILAFMYFTRWEAFLYIWSIVLIFSFLLVIKKISFKKYLTANIVLFLSFFIFISPYLIYLHSITWEWGLTNKWTANLRQAQMRWIDKMDDTWFEKAVWELTQDNHSLKAWFAWWLKYEKAQKMETWLIWYVLDNKHEFFYRFIDNQTKLYSQNIVHLVVWNSSKLFFVEWSFFYKNYLFLVIILSIMILMIFWIIKMILDKKYFFVVSFFSFFIVSSLFFSIFFILDRYFVVFVPFFIFFIVYGLQSIKINLKYFENIKYSLWVILLIWIYTLWIYTYYNNIKESDNKFEVKKIAWEWIKQNDFRQNISIMERWPIVTYYAQTKNRFLTPYTDNIKNLIKYANYNKIDYLVVDTIDFKTYRPDLWYLLDVKTDIKWLKPIKIFNKNSEKVIIYQFK